MMVTVSRSKLWAIFVSLVLVSLLFHTYNLEYASYDLDEAAHIWHAQKDYSDVVEQASQDPNPPVYNLLLSAWVKTFGVSEFSTRFLSVLFGALGVGLMFLIGTRNFGLAVGVMAALFYCFSPIQFRFTHLARPYSILMVTVLLSYGALLEVLKKPDKRKLFWYYLATTIMIYVHPTSVFNVAVQGLIILWNKGKDFRQILLLSVPLAGAVFSFGVWVVSIPYFERNDTMWFGPPNWEDIKYVLLAFYSSKWIVFAQVAILALLLNQWRKSKPKKEVGNMLLIAIWALVPFVISIVFSLLLKPVFQDKYILSVQPAMMLLLAYSIYQLKGKPIKTVGFGLTFVLLLGAMDTTRNPEGDWRKAIEYIQPIHHKNSAVFINPWYEFRTFSYYFDRHSFEVPDSTIKLLVSKGVFTAWHDVYDTVYDVPKTDVLHLFLAHQDFVEGVDVELLKEHAFLVNQKDFSGISVQSYQFYRKIGVHLEDFNSEPNQVELLDITDTLSQAVTVSLSQAQKVRQLKISATVKLHSNYGMEGVVLIVSVEKEGEKPFVYRNTQANQNDNTGGWIELSDKFTLTDFQSDWIVKAYFWR